MEEDIHDSILEQKKTKDNLIETRLKKAVEKAEEVLNYESAHDSEILHALDIVKDFISKKKRICYGGTAMNVLLPKKHRFYNPDYDLPDYDFLTPDGDSDVKELVNALKAAGYNDVYNRVGVHEGTKKILVNYIAVADITDINDDIYNTFLKNSKVIDGVHYTNENMLRMMMYLELSRPRGEVERWEKVFKRIQLLNKHFPIKACSKIHYQKNVSGKDKVLEFIISRQRVLANLELESLYKRSLVTKNVHYKLHNSGPLMFYSSNIKKDAFDLKHSMESYNLKIVYYNGKGDYLPSRIQILNNGVPLAVIIQESACHSYNNIKTEDGRNLHIASLETLITLHYSFHFFNKHEKTYICDIGKCIRTQALIAASKKSIFEPFPIHCTGYQKGYPTLLREKVVRIEKEKTHKKSAKKSTTLKKSTKVK